MKISTNDRVCDCGTRVLWIGEDEAGDVAVVSRRLHIFSRKSLAVTAHRYNGIPLAAFVSGVLITLVEVPGGGRIQLPGQQTVDIPASPHDVYDSCYDRSTQQLYLLTNSQLFRIDVRGARLAEAMEIHGEPDEPPYTKIDARSDYVVAYRYGMTIWSSSGHRYEYNDIPYSEVALISSERILAVAENEVIHVYHPSLGLVDDMKMPRGVVHYTGCVGATPVIVWGQGSELWGGILGHGRLNEIPIGVFHAESCTPIEENHCLAIGTLEGYILLWNLNRGSSDRVHIPGRPRVVELFWSHSLRRLFIGTRRGTVYAVQVPIEAGTSPL